MSPPVSSTLRNIAAKQRVPAERPPFTIGELRASIPAHCFKRSALKSGAYLLLDLAIVAVLFVIANAGSQFLSDERFGSVAPALRGVFWVAYWIVQGCVMTGLWVIGHECGHGGFSESELLNDSVGFVVHSALLVPFFSWKISHRRHHSNTGSLTRDEVFVPVHHREDVSDNPLLHSAPVRAIAIVSTLTIGWFAYLLFNTTGNDSYRKGAWVNHFTPGSPIYNSRERKLVVLSDIGLCAMGYVLYTVAKQYGGMWVFFMYGVPYFIVNFWLVLITLLQHTDVALPHYDANEWDWLRGALATVDRDFGILNKVFHHIGDTHVTHHLFSALPFYHAEEATVALKKKLGDYYRFDDTPIAVALWECYRECVWVEPDDNANPGIYWFRSLYGNYAQKKKL